MLGALLSLEPGDLDFLKLARYTAVSTDWVGSMLLQTKGSRGWSKAGVEPILMSSIWLFL